MLELVSVTLHAFLQIPSLAVTDSTTLQTLKGLYLKVVHQHIEGLCFKISGYHRFMCIRAPEHEDYVKSLFAASL